MQHKAGLWWFARSYMAEISALSARCCRITGKLRSGPGSNTLIVMGLPDAKLSNPMACLAALKLLST